MNSIIYPSHIIKNIFYKIVLGGEEVHTTHSFLHKGKCPLCNDYKKRMYVKQYPDGHYHIYCHNCGYSQNFPYFIKNYFPEYLHELTEFYLNYLKEEKNNKNINKNEKKELKEEKNEFVEKYLTDIKISSYLEENAFLLKEENLSSSKELIRKYAIEYLKNRKIQEKYWKDFYFIYKGPLKGYIGIPMWDENHILLHVQGRLLLKSKNVNYEQPKYIFLKDSSKGIENIPKPIYGLWRANKEKTCYFSEGTLSCLAFGDQGLSTCGANISLTFVKKIKNNFKNVIWSFDNYWIDETARKKTNFLLENNETCFIIPKNIPCKDTNDLLIYFNWEEIPEEFIQQNLFTGKTGLIKLKLMF
ncbi:MAG: hypothetical protein NZZ41_01685 [Candidatus Dojkabacteria bacterium]|nr:hypothetical protein [Candidatus Dojkabacteria bacterium]